jgi:hypothetical protein
MGIYLNISLNKFVTESKYQNLHLFKIRKVKSSDCHKIYNLVTEIEPLRQFDQNIYTLICQYFATNSLLLEYNNEIVGIAIGFYLPNKPDTFYILQFGLKKEYRRNNIAVDFFRLFIQQFNGCSRFHFTMRALNLKRKQILRLIEIVTKSSCNLMEIIDYSDDEIDYKYEGKYDINNSSCVLESFENLSVYSLEVIQENLNDKTWTNFIMQKLSIN